MDGIGGNRIASWTSRDMKLFYKIYLFLLLVLILVLAGSGYTGYRREVALFDSDMKKDALILGKALSGMVEHT